MNDVVFCVYWMGGDEIEDEYPCAAIETDMGVALAKCEALRKEGKRFVTMVSENRNCTSIPGAVVLDAKNYEWKKRR